MRPPLLRAAYARPGGQFCVKTVSFTEQKNRSLDGFGVLPDCSVQSAREALLALRAVPEEDILKWYAFHKGGHFTD